MNNGSLEAKEITSLLHEEDDEEKEKFSHESEEALNELELATATYEDRFRIEELGIVAFILILWMGAIMLFVHRWGKIRMLIPHQPQYVLEKEDPPVVRNAFDLSLHSFTRYLPNKKSIQRLS